MALAACAEQCVPGDLRGRTRLNANVRLQAAMANLKTIRYRGGIAEFTIPSHWREEYEPGGGGTFYEDSPGSGTLRLNVLSFESQNTPAEQMAATAFRDGKVWATTSGLPLRCEENAAEENGESLHIVSWEVAIPVPPKSLRLAIFSYTIIKKELQNPAIIAEIKQLQRSVEQARYSQAAGIAGDYEHA